MACVYTTTPNPRNMKIADRTSPANNLNVKPAYVKLSFKVPI